MRQVTNITPISQTRSLRHREGSLPKVTELIGMVPETTPITPLYCERDHKIKKGFQTPRVVAVPRHVKGAAGESDPLWQ